MDVAIKTCKVDSDDSVAEKFLEEACKSRSFSGWHVLMGVRSYIVC